MSAEHELPGGWLPGPSEVKDGRKPKAELPRNHRIILLRDADGDGVAEFRSSPLRAAVRPECLAMS